MFISHCCVVRWNPHDDTPPHPAAAPPPPWGQHSEPPQRFWVPHPGQPTSSDTVGMYPQIPAGLSREKHNARLSSKPPKDPVKRRRTDRRHLHPPLTHTGSRLFHYQPRTLPWWIQAERGEGRGLNIALMLPSSPSFSSAVSLWCVPRGADQPNDVSCGPPSHLLPAATSLRNIENWSRKRTW